MEIKCTNDEWLALEIAIKKEYTISTDYDYPNFTCLIYDKEDQFFVDINGVFIQEIS